MSEWGAGSHHPAIRARIWRWRALMVFVVILGVLIGGYLTRRGTTGRLAVLASSVQELLAPVQAGVSGALAGLSRQVHLLANYWQLDSENRRLREEIVRLQLEIASLREARRENELLRELLSMKAPPEYRVVSATIIGRSPRQWTSQLIIDRGQDRAVDVGAVVVSTGGVVGRVVAATPSSARVLLITDPSSAVGGLVERTGDLVLVEGMPGSATRLKARTLSPHAELKPGDVILTSGVGGLFPKGLPLGTVVDVKVDPYGLATSATLQPAVDFGRLEYLLVLVPKEKADSGKGAAAVAGPAENSVAAKQKAPSATGRPETTAPASPVGGSSLPPRSQGDSDREPQASVAPQAVPPVASAEETAIPEMPGVSPVDDNAEPGIGGMRAESLPGIARGDNDGAVPAGQSADTGH